MPHVILIFLLPSGLLGAQPLLSGSVQYFHRRLDVAGNKFRQYLNSLIDRLIDQHAIVTGRRLQHVANDIITVTRVTDTDAQSQEVLAPQMRDQVTQSIVTAMTTILLELDGTHRKIKIIMHNQHGAARNTIEAGQRRHRHATAIHEVHGFLQPQVLARHGTTGKLAFVFTLGPELRIAEARNFIDEPEPGIMPGLFVFASGITQPGDELYGSQ